MKYLFFLILSLSADLAVADCDGLAKSNFATIHTFTVGRGVSGPVKGSWTVAFDNPENGKARLRSADYTLTGAYQCQGSEGEITFQSLNDVAPQIVGYYNQDTELLILNGKWYKKTN